MSRTSSNVLRDEHVTAAHADEDRIAAEPADKDVVAGVARNRVVASAAGEILNVDDDI